MGKVKIIIADTDEDYIIPLQTKFVEELSDSADLEIITDSNYFAKFFMTPQKADILIVSEELYINALHRHNIGRIFVLVERQEEENTTKLNVIHLCKYTSIKEIYAEITGISPVPLGGNGERKESPQIITVCSASGGTGKTTVALGISACLSKHYKRVLYIGADRLQSFQRLLDDPTPISSTEIYTRLNSETGNAYSAVRHTIRKQSFSYLPPFRVALLSLGLGYDVFTRLAVSARDADEYDYIIVDADTAFDEDKAQLLSASDKVVVVTMQNSQSVFATNLLCESINGLNTEKFIFVCNNFNRNQENALVSSELVPKFVPSEYINHFENYDRLKCLDFSKDSGIQKVTVLIM